MECSIRQFLEHGTLGGLSLGLDQESVLASLGKPNCWEGSTTFSATESRIWIYNALELVFEKHRKIEIIRFFLRAHGEKDHLTGALTHEPLQFLDADLCAIAEYTAFTGYLDRHKICWETGLNSVGQQIVRTAKCNSKFIHLLDSEQSVPEGRRIASDSKYLVSISTRFHEKHQF